MYYIGIDLGGTNIAVGLVSEDGKILRKAETPTLAKRPYADIVRDMAACIAKLLDEAKLTAQDIAEELRDKKDDLTYSADELKNGIVVRRGKKNFNKVILK